MKYTYKTLTMWLLLALSQVAVAHDNTTSNSYTDMTGTHLLPTLTQLCFRNKTSVEVIGASGKKIKKEKRSAELKELLDTKMQPALARLPGLSRMDSNVVECEHEDLQSLSMAVLRFSTTIKESSDESGFYEIVVRSKLGVVLKLESEGVHARPYLIVTSARALTKKQDELQDMAVKEVLKQIDAITDAFEKEQ